MSSRPGFTLRPVTWTPWVETIDDIDATDEQREVLESVSKSKASRPYWATLAHDAPVLRARQHLFEETLRGKDGDEHGAPKPDLELAAVATSKANGCVYCASVHARAFERLTDRADLVQAVLDHGPDADLPERERALVAFTFRLTEHPADLAPSDLRAMRDAGFRDLEIYDIAHAVAMFAWANRLMLTLGGQTLDETSSASS